MSVSNLNYAIKKRRQHVILTWYLKHYHFDLESDWSVALAVDYADHFPLKYVLYLGTINIVSNFIPCSLWGPVLNLFLMVVDLVDLAGQCSLAKLQFQETIKIDPMR